MTRLSILRTALTFGIFMALFHAAWAALVALHWAQPLLDFIFRCTSSRRPTRSETLIRPRRSPWSG